eukprot:3130507-Lingulodinium_polyedra.AAC.1
MVSRCGRKRSHRLTPTTNVHPSGSLRLLSVSTSAELTYLHTSDVRGSPNGLAVPIRVIFVPDSFCTGDEDWGQRLEGIA